MSPPWCFRSFPYDSEDYKQAWDLRERVLRQPLGLSLRDEDLSGEIDQIHFGLFDQNGTLLACLTAVADLVMNKAKLRQMAVDPEKQGLGLGRHLMLEAEKSLRDRGISFVQLNARLTARDFYARLGYTELGGIFNEVTIPHIRMEKSL